MKHVNSHKIQGAKRVNKLKFRSYKENVFIRISNINDINTKTNYFVA